MSYELVAVAAAAVITAACLARRTKVVAPARTAGPEQRPEVDDLNRLARLRRMGCLPKW